VAAESPARAAQRGELLKFLGAWLALGLLAFALAGRDLSEPGLYYDEVIQAEAAREFLDPNGSPQRIPGASSARLLGRWLPVFTQPYMGALKSQLLIPGFALFGASAESLRAITLVWGLVGLLFAMLFAWRLLGLRAALLSGALLAVDPSFLFVSRHDWGSFALALLLRCAGMLLLLIGWRRARGGALLFAAGLCFGLGLYNKIDFAAPLAAAALALVMAAPRAVAESLRAPGRLLPIAAGLLLGVAPLLAELGTALQVTQSAAAADAGLWQEKLAALLSTLDGSYFDRLMRAGGSFERMFEAPDPAAGPFLLIYALALGGLAVRLARRWEPATVFVLAAAVLSSLGILAIPRAVRIHHVLGAWPFPQYVVTLGILALAGSRGQARRAAAAAVAAIVLGGGAWASLRTLDTIQRSHGKGRWSDATGQLARELAAEPGVVAVALDWGLRAQIRFLDRGLDVREPVWELTRRDPEAPPWSFQGDTRVIYLLWDQDFAVFPVGPAFLETVRGIDSNRVEIRRHADRDGDPAFVSVRIAGPHRIVYRGAHSARPFEVILE
jgi:hypothetical protein